MRATIYAGRRETSKDGRAEIRDTFQAVIDSSRSSPQRRVYDQRSLDPSKEISEDYSRAGELMAGHLSDEGVEEIIFANGQIADRQKSPVTGIDKARLQAFKEGMLAKLLKAQEVIK